MQYKHAADKTLCPMLENIISEITNLKQAADEPVNEEPVSEDPPPETLDPEQPAGDEPIAEGDTGEQQPFDDGQPIDFGMDSNPEMEDLKKRLEELEKDKTLQGQVNVLKRKLDRLQINDDPNLNDSIFQSATKKYVMRRISRLEHGSINK